MVGGAAKALLVSQAISPRLLDVVMRRIGFEIHYTDEPKSEDASDNLFAPIENHDTVEGSFSNRAHLRSFYTWLQLPPTVKRSAIAAGTTLGVLVILRARL